MKKGLFALPQAHVDAATMDAIEWWSTYGSETPELAEVAKKVLSQPISSSYAERNWSTYSYIHSIKRNRLNNKRADKLLFVHSNIRLVSQFSESYKEGPFKEWDINPESSNLESSSVRLDDMQWESLYKDVAGKAKGKRQRVD
ncbi:HAT dimerization domain, Ribonuclease H-like domain protein [Artemisia annua]|uniref:HAT dimerization domain, Ribonuclease H-like domain protein n=1 Tax=Artemisia annua TaxID=35608 RepID=A0A2U1NUW2_ARTAN|nr:HAT dimerization domain, Ribonuclease H-like domain protein [Artemisia annua]